MEKARIEIEKVNNGYVVAVYEPQPTSGNEIYPDYKREEMVAGTRGEVIDMLNQFLDGKSAPYETEKQG